MKIKWSKRKNCQRNKLYKKDFENNKTKHYICFVFFFLICSTETYKFH